MSRKKPIRSLLCLLQGLENYTTTVELRNEFIVHGTIQNVDDNMNITLTDATYSMPYGQQEDVFEQVFIHGSQIRYVLIPDEVNVMKTIIKQVKEETERGQPKYSRQKILPSRLKRHREERQMVREYLMGKGRGKAPQLEVPNKSIELTKSNETESGN